MLVQQTIPQRDSLLTGGDRVGEIVRTRPTNLRYACHVICAVAPCQTPDAPGSIVAEILYVVRPLIYRACPHRGPAASRGSP